MLSYFPQLAFSKIFLCSKQLGLNQPQFWQDLINVDVLGLKGSRSGLYTVGCICYQLKLCGLYLLFTTRWKLPIAVMLRSVIICDENVCCLFVCFLKIENFIPFLLPSTFLNSTNRSSTWGNGRQLVNDEKTLCILYPNFC